MSNRMLASFDEESDIAGNLPYSGVARIGLQSIVAYDKHALFDENLSNLTSAHSDADRFELRSGKKNGDSQNATEYRTANA